MITRRYHLGGRTWHPQYLLTQIMRRYRLGDRTWHSHPSFHTDFRSDCGHITFETPSRAALVSCSYIMYSSDNEAVSSRGYKPGTHILAFTHTRCLVVPKRFRAQSVPLKLLQEQLRPGVHSPYPSGRDIQQYTAVAAPRAWGGGRRIEWVTGVQREADINFRCWRMVVEGERGGGAKPYHTLRVYEYHERLKSPYFLSRGLQPNGIL